MMKRLQLDDCRRLFPLVVVPKVRMHTKLFSNICHLESQKTENALKREKNWIAEQCNHNALILK